MRQLQHGVGGHRADVLAAVSEPDPVNPERVASLDMKPAFYCCLHVAGEQHPLALPPYNRQLTCGAQSCRLVKVVSHKSDGGKAEGLYFGGAVVSQDNQQ